MSRKQVDHRPDERPAGHAPGKHDPSKPKPGRMPESSQEDTRFQQPAGQPVDKELRGWGKDIFDGERSDRESGRPVQLEEDEEGQAFLPDQPRRVAAGGRQQEGRRDRSPREVDPTKR